MFPRLFDFGSFEIFGRSFHPILHNYGLLLFAGFVAGIWFAARRAPATGSKAATSTTSRSTCSSGR